MIHLSVRTLSAPWLTRLNWDELSTLTVCVCLDLLEYVVPPLLVPMAGDILDLGGIAFCLAYFGWSGLISIAELVPGMDIAPIFTATWLVWYLFKRRRARIEIEGELEKWR